MGGTGRHRQSAACRSIGSVEEPLDILAIDARLISGFLAIIWMPMVLLEDFQNLRRYEALPRIPVLAVLTRNLALLGYR